MTNVLLPPGIFEAFVLFAYLVASVGVGGALLRCLSVLFKANFRTGLSDVVLAFLIGQGAYGVLWLFLGLFGRLSPQSVFFLILLPCICVIGLAPLGTYHLKRSTRLLRSEWGNLSLFEKIGWTVILYWLARLAVRAIAAPLPLPGDGGSFYMLIAKLAAVTGQILPLDGREDMSQVYLHGEAHFAALMALGIQSAAKGIAFFHLLAALSTLLLIGFRLGLSSLGLMALSFLALSSTVFTFHVWDGKVDLFGASYGLASIYCALLLKDDRFSWNVLPFISCFLALAISAKLSLLVTLPVCVIGIMLLNWDKLPAVNWSRQLTFSIAAVLIVLSPNILKNMLWFSEPFSPFFIFSDTSVKLVADNVTWYSPENIRKIILSYPLVLIFGQYPMQHGNLSPLVLMVLPIWWVLDKELRTSPSTLSAVSIFAVIGVASWMFFRPGIVAPRYLMPTLLLLCIFPAYCVQLLLTNFRRYRFASFATVAAFVWISIGTFATINIVPPGGLGDDIKRLPGAIDNTSGAWGFETPMISAFNVLNREGVRGAKVYAPQYRYWVGEHLIKDSFSDYKMFVSYLNSSEKMDIFAIIDIAAMKGAVDELKNMYGVDLFDSSRFVELFKVGDTVVFRMNSKSEK